MKQHVRQWRICDLMTNTAWGHPSPCTHADICTAPRKSNNVQSFAWCTVFVLTGLREVSWRERRLVGSTYARRMRSNAVGSITLTSSAVLCGNREEIYHRHTFLAAADHILQRKWFVLGGKWELVLLHACFLIRCFKPSHKIISVLLVATHHYFLIVSRWIRSSWVRTIREGPHPYCSKIF